MWACVFLCFRFLTWCFWLWVQRTKSPGSPHWVLPSHGPKTESWTRYRHTVTECLGPTKRSVHSHWLHTHLHLRLPWEIQPPWHSDASLPHSGAKAHTNILWSQNTSSAANLSWMRLQTRRFHLFILKWWYLDDDDDDDDDWHGSKRRKQIKYLWPNRHKFNL